MAVKIVSKSDFDKIKNGGSGGAGGDNPNPTVTQPSQKAVDTANAVKTGSFKPGYLEGTYIRSGTWQNDGTLDAKNPETGANAIDPMTAHFMKNAGHYGISEQQAGNTLRQTGALDQNLVNKYQENSGLTDSDLAYRYIYDQDLSKEDNDYVLGDMQTQEYENFNQHPEYFERGLNPRDIATEYMNAVAGTPYTAEDGSTQYSGGYAYEDNSPYAQGKNSNMSDEERTYRKVTEDFNNRNNYWNHQYDMLMQRDPRYTEEGREQFINYYKTSGADPIFKAAAENINEATSQWEEYKFNNPTEEDARRAAEELALQASGIGNFRNNGMADDVRGAYYQNVMNNPELAGASGFNAQTPNAPSAPQALYPSGMRLNPAQQAAVDAGYQPGTPEFRDFIINYIQRGRGASTTPTRYEPEIPTYNNNPFGAF